MLACVIFTASGGNTLASLFNKANAVADGGKQRRTTFNGPVMPLWPFSSS